MAVLQEHIISMSSELRFIKWVRFFEWNCIVKWVIFFGSFSWLWDFLLKNLKLKKKSDDVHWNVWTNIKKFHVRKNIFKKINLNMRFWGTVSGRFSQCFFFFNFSTSPSNGGQHFYSPPPPRHHKKAFYGHAVYGNPIILL